MTSKRENNRSFLRNRIIIVLVIIAAILAAIWFFTVRDTEEPEPQPVEEEVVVEPELEPEPEPIWFELKIDGDFEITIKQGETFDGHNVKVVDKEGKEMVGMADKVRTEFYLSKNHGKGELQKELDTDTPGRYAVRYILEEDGFEAACVGALEVSEPVWFKINLLGDSAITMWEGDDYEEPGFEVLNKEDKRLRDLESKVELEFYLIQELDDGTEEEVLQKELDTNMTGKYKVYYLLEEEDFCATCTRDLIIKKRPKKKVVTNASESESESESESVVESEKDNSHEEWIKFQQMLEQKEKEKQEEEARNSGDSGGDGNTGGGGNSGDDGNTGGGDNSGGGGNTGGGGNSGGSGNTGGGNRDDGDGGDGGGSEIPGEGGNTGGGDRDPGDGGNTGGGDRDPGDGGGGGNGTEI